MSVKIIPLVWRRSGADRGGYKKQGVSGESGETSLIPREPHGRARAPYTEPRGLCRGPLPNTWSSRGSQRSCLLQIPGCPRIWAAAAPLLGTFLSDSWSLLTAWVWTTDDSKSIVEPRRGFRSPNTPSPFRQQFRNRLFSWKQRVVVVQGGRPRRP